MTLNLSNKEVAAKFDLLVKLLELSGENPFKIKSYSIAAFRINKLAQPVLSMTDAEIRKIENIGPAVIAKLEEIKQHGSIIELETLLEKTPPGIVEMLQLKGLGAKKVRQLWLELEIESIGELAYACQENRLTSLKGFGKKTQDSILANIQFLLAHKDQMLYANVDILAYDLLKAIQSLGDYQVHLVGDVARQLNTIKSIEYLTNMPIDLINDFFINHYNVEATQGLNNEYNIQVEDAPNIKFIIAEKQEIPYLLLKLNSSDAFFTHLSHHYTIDSSIEQEQDFFTQNNIQYIPAAKREINNIDLLETDTKPTIEASNIKGLIHCHSDWSDGLHSIRDMAIACIERGLEYMVITDHSISAFYANGLTPERIFDQHKEIDKLNIELAPFKIFKGIEADIRYNGELDYDENVWKSFEVIIASVHSNLRMMPEHASMRIMKALDNPYVTILGHPTGRLLLSRDGYSVDINAIIEKCSDRNIAIEINAHPRRLDLDWSHINDALAHNVMMSINPDAHSIEGIDLIKYGIISAQKSKLAATQNLSSMSLPAFEAYLQSRKK